MERSPTKELKTLDRGFQLFCERLLLRKILQQRHQRCLTVLFDLKSVVFCEKLTDEKILSLTQKT